MLKKSAVSLIHVSLTLFIALFIFPSKIFAFSSGSGTEADPWIITTADELNSVRNYLGSSNQDKYFKLGNSINLDVTPYNSGSGWSKLGSDATNSFRGHFDGDGKTINNLYINSTGSQYDSVFGYVYSSAVIENLGVEDVSITLTSPETFSYVGGIAGSNSGTIQNCYATGSISGGNHFSGGISGSNNGTIKKSYSLVNLTGTHYNGGISGSCGTVEDSYNLGTIHGSLYTAGICGKYTGTIRRIYNAGAVSGSTAAAIASLAQGGSILDSYYDNQTSLIGGLGNSKTTLEMQQQSTYVDWDFDNIWAFQNGVNNGYPILQWQDIPPTAPPTTQSSEITTTNAKYNSVTLSWNRGDGDNCQVFIKEGTEGTAIPENNGNYISNSSFGNGSQIGTTGWYAVYSGTGNSTTVTNLTQSTTYRVQVFEHNGSVRNAWYLTDASTNNPINTSTTELTTPTTQAQDISITNITHQGATIN